MRKSVSTLRKLKIQSTNQKKTCAEVYAQIMNAGLPSCPTPLAEKCPQTCGTCPETTSQPPETTAPETTSSTYVPGCQVYCSENWVGDNTCDESTGCYMCPHFWNGDVFDGGDCDPRDYNYVSLLDTHSYDFLSHGNYQCDTYSDSRDAAIEEAKSYCSAHSDCGGFAISYKWVQFCPQFFSLNPTTHHLSDWTFFVKNEEECVDVAQIEDPATNQMITCAEVYAQIMNAGLPSCPTLLAEQCPQTCGTCPETTSQPPENPAPETTSSTYVCQVYCSDNWVGDKTCDETTGCYGCPHFWNGDVFDGGDCETHDGCPAHCADSWVGDSICDESDCTMCPHFWNGDLFDGGDCGPYEVDSSYDDSSYDDDGLMWEFNYEVYADSECDNSAQIYVNSQSRMFQCDVGVIFSCASNGLVQLNEYEDEACTIFKRSMPMLDAECFENDGFFLRVNYDTNPCFSQIESTEIESTTTDSIHVMPTIKDTFRFTTSELGQNCDYACGEIEEECVEDMFLQYSAEEVASWALAVDVTCTAIVDRCDIGESPIFNWRNGECTFCSNPNHPGWTNGNRCGARWHDRERICACTSSSFTAAPTNRLITGSPSMSQPTRSPSKSPTPAGYEGSLCSVDEDCDSARCNFSELPSRCREKESHLSDCNRDVDCESEHCLGRKCVDGRDNDRCNSNDDCQSGRCAFGMPFGKCQTQAEHGENCIRNDDCASEDCLLFTCTDHRDGAHCVNDDDCLDGSSCVWSAKGATCKKNHGCTWWNWNECSEKCTWFQKVTSTCY
eukprot:UN01419